MEYMAVVVAVVFWISVFNIDYKIKFYVLALYQNRWNGILWKLPWHQGENMNDLKKNSILSDYCDCVKIVYLVGCAIWYHLYNLKNVKNTREGLILLVKLQDLACNCTKINTPPWVFSRFLNCTNGTKTCKASHIRFNIIIGKMGRVMISKH